MGVYLKPAASECYYLPRVYRFRPSLPSEPAPFDALLWRLTKDTREVSAVVRAMVHGRELRIYVGQELLRSHLFSRDEGTKALLQLSATTREQFESRGWTRDVTV